VSVWTQELSKWKRENRVSPRKSAAMHRATHLLWDAPPKLLEDTLALRLCGLNETALRQANNEAVGRLAEHYGADFAKRFFRTARSITVLRSRYVEDELDEALRRGVSQYVSLGAGLDSFAYRKQHLVDVLRVFEVDHPATQAWKRELLHAAGLPLPRNLTLVPVDFEKEALTERLRMRGYRPEKQDSFHG
jgi:methyltransferase (TIGR00027 family)